MDDQEKRRQAHYEWTRAARQYQQQNEEHNYTQHSISNHPSITSAVAPSLAGRSYEHHQNEDGYNHIQAEDPANIASLLQTLQHQSQSNAFTLNNMSIEQLLRMRATQLQYQSQQQLTQNHTNNNNHQSNHETNHHDQFPINDMYDPGMCAADDVIHMNHINTPYMDPSMLGNYHHNDTYSVNDQRYEPDFYPSRDSHSIVHHNQQPYQSSVAPGFISDVEYLDEVAKINRATAALASQQELLVLHQEMIRQLASNEQAKKLDEQTQLLAALQLQLNQQQDMVKANMSQSGHVASADLSNFASPSQSYNPSFAQLALGSPNPQPPPINSHFEPRNSLTMQSANEFWSQINESLINSAAANALSQPHTMRDNFMQPANMSHEQSHPNNMIASSPLLDQLAAINSFEAFNNSLISTLASSSAVNPHRHSINADTSTSGNILNNAQWFGSMMNMDTFPIPRRRSFTITEEPESVRLEREREAGETSPSMMRHTRSIEQQSIPAERSYQPPAPSPAFDQPELPILAAHLAGLRSHTSPPPDHHQSPQQVSTFPSMFRMDQPLPPVPALAAGSKRRASGSSETWVCPFKCSKIYRTTSTRSISRHLQQCQNKPLFQALMAASHVAPSDIFTGKRKQKRRRRGEELAAHERWNCPNRCGKFFRSTSTRSIHKHKASCTFSLLDSVSDAPPGDEDEDEEQDEDEERERDLNENKSHLDSSALGATSQSETHQSSSVQSFSSQARTLDHHEHDLVEFAMSVFSLRDARIRLEECLHLLHEDDSDISDTDNEESYDDNSGARVTSQDSTSEAFVQADSFEDAAAVLSATADDSRPSSARSSSTDEHHNDPASRSDVDVESSASPSPALSLASVSPPTSRSSHSPGTSGRVSFSGIDSPISSDSAAGCSLNNSTSTSGSTRSSSFSAISANYSPVLKSLVTTDEDNSDKRSRCTKCFIPKQFRQELASSVQLRDDLASSVHCMCPPSSFVVHDS